MTEPENDSYVVIPGSVVAILASTCCLNPFTLLSLGYAGALTERGLEIARLSDARHRREPCTPALNQNQRRALGGRRAMSPTACSVTDKTGTGR